MLGNSQMADSGDGILEWVWRQETQGGFGSSPGNDCSRSPQAE